MAELQTVAAPASSRVLPPPNRRRDKPQLSCNACRSRKLKCDREHPCEACRRRGCPESCTYVTSNIPSKRARGQGLPSRTPSDVDGHIVQSKDLVTSLAHSETKSTSSEIQRSKPTALPRICEHEGVGLDLEVSPPFLTEFGRINLSCMETTYVGNSHWAAILDNIADFRRNSQNDGPDCQPPLGAKIIYDSGEPDISFGTYHSLNSHQILAAMPPRDVADQLVAEYFSQGSLASVIIHSPTFLKQYEQFWRKPEETSIIWVGLLFAVMCLARLYEQQKPNPDLQGHRIIQRYRERIAQCVVLGKYPKCPPFTIETLLLLLHIENNRQQETQMETWLLLSTTVRLALRAGYHRDPSHFPQILPFDGEMRRRTWASVVQFDTLLSIQFGLPGTIKDSLCDTAEPLNLLEEDLGENMTEPPQARPDTLHTPMAFLLAKTKIARIYRDIVDLIESIKPTSYGEVMRLESVLSNIYSSIPDGLKMLPLTQTLNDTPDITMQRFELTVLYHRAKCFLHYRYIAFGHTDSEYVYSQSTCVEAALNILQCHQTLKLETWPGGRFSPERWKFTPSPFYKSSFYFAATLLCLFLNGDAGSAVARKIADSECKRRVVESLNTSYQIWAQERSPSKEVQTLIKVLGIVLGMAKEEGLRESFIERMIVDNSPNYGSVPESSARTDASLEKPSLARNYPGMQLLMGLNTSSEIDFSETIIPQRPLNLTQSEDDLSDISLGFSRAYGFANEGVRKAFGGARED